MLHELIPLCWVNRHAPDRDAVDWDGHHYVGQCRRCGEAIRRRKRKLWQRDWFRPG